MTHSKGRTFVLLFLGLVLCFGLAQAQTGTASLFGEIADPSGAAIVGAKVVLTNEGTKASRETTTDATGRYQFVALAPGRYAIRVEMNGFRTATSAALELLVNTASKFNVGLEVGSLTETVTISEAAAALNTTDASLGNVITPKQVLSIPLEGRNPAALLTLQSGVAFSGDFTDQRSGAVSGARSDQSNLTLDGVDINDQQTQDTFAPAIPIPLESIQEFRFTTGNPTADQGRSSGGQIGFITRSGTNEFHGSAFWYHRNTATTANDFFLNRSGVKTPKLLRNQFGGSGGGPLWRDRLFIFGTYEGTTRREEQNVLRIVPTDSMKQGQLKYLNAAGAVVTLSPANLQTIDPAGLGVNNAALTVLQAFPACNDFAQGLDATGSAPGLNFCGFRFNAPVAANNHVYVAKMDFNITRDARHSVSLRGTLNDVSSDLTPPQFPGHPVAQQLLDNSKGLSAGYTAVLSNNWVSTFRYGYTREGFENSGQVGDLFSFRSFDNPFSAARALLRNVPVHNLVEDMTWTRGKHTMQFGANFRFIHNNRTSFANSFATFNVNDGFCQRLCGDIFAQVTGAGFAAVPGTAQNPFKRTIMALYGMITTINSAAFFDGTNNTLASGQGASRSFIYNEHEYYVQDTWRWTRNLTLTAGVRYQYYGVPYEKDGLQTGTTVNVMDFILQRAQLQAAGQPSANAPLLSWDLIGKANNAPGYYNPDKNNFSPSLSFAYTPGFSDGVLAKLFGGSGKSVIRGGFRTVFDRVGGSMVVSQDLNGAVGLLSPLSNRTGLLNYTGPACTVPPTVACAAPRFTGLSSLPAVANFMTVPAAGFPSTPPSTISNRGFAIDQSLKTPYSYAVQVSYGRELPGAMNLEVSYVGRFGQGLLTKADIAAPLIYSPDAAGTTFAQAIQQLYVQTGTMTVPISRNPLSSTFNPAAHCGPLLAGLAPVQPVAYFESLFSGLAGFICPGITATQFVYTQNARHSHTDTLINIEGLADAAFPTYFQHQFDSLPAWTNLGRSNYHGLQATLRKRFTDGLTFDFNYTWSKSMDNASSIENATRLGGQIADVFNSRNGYARSGFDLLHQVSINWVYELPVGRGKKFFSSASGVWEQIFGGWQTSGIFRWRGAFPISPSNGFNFPTNFFQTTPGTWTCRPDVDFQQSATGGPNLFTSPAAALACLAFTEAGGSGSRSSLRGVRFTNTDMGIRKYFQLPVEGHRFVFEWQAFNLFNHPNFDDRNLALNPESSGTFGRFTSTIGQDLRNTNGRVMQFALRYEF